MRTRNRLERRKRLIRLITLLLFVSAILLIFIKRIPSKKQNLVVPVLTEYPTITLTISPTPFTNNPGLTQAVEEALTGTHGTYGIVVKNMETNDLYFAHQTHVFKAGSLYKLWVMATVFSAIENGKLKEDTKVSQSVKELNERFHISPALAEKKDGTIVFTVKDALYQMITISDNYAGLLLAEKVSLPSISAFLQSHGLNGSKVGINGKDPITTPLDTALFFEKLYKGQLGNKENTEKMIALLKGQKLNEKLPKYLPDDVIVAHKTGELDNFTHDAGIVYLPNGEYVLVILSESDSREQAEERIASVSEAVYNYFTKGQ